MCARGHVHTRTHIHTSQLPRHAPTTCQAPSHLDAQHSAYSRGLTGARPRTSSPQEGRPHREGSWRARRISNPHKSLLPPPWRGRVLLYPEAWRPDPATEALGKGMGPPAFGGWDRQHLGAGIIGDSGHRRQGAPEKQVPCTIWFPPHAHRWGQHFIIPTQAGAHSSCRRPQSCEVAGLRLKPSSGQPLGLWSES